MAVQFEPTMSDGFIRVRRWVLNGATGRACPDPRAAATSMGFEIVRAVRINGKPRQRLVVYLGSFKDVPDLNPVAFWIRAIRSMRGAGFDRQQRANLADQLIRKGARLPTLEQCVSAEDAARHLHFEGPLEELRAIIAGVMPVGRTDVVTPSDPGDQGGAT